ncbi:MAG: polymer-forming cytoskeletal protein [Myxococcales bacterium]|nr:polymer-forming cytoskeletal protein [Myxococcales bacterium]
MSIDNVTGYVGPGLVVRGQVSGEGDLVVDGVFEGSLSLRGRVAVGPPGRLRAPVEAHLVSVEGRLEGHVTAGEIVVREGGRLHGDVRAPSVGIEDGGVLLGSVTMDVELPPGLDDSEER